MTGPSNSFMKHLCDVQLDHVFNPYTDCCPLHDQDDAPSRRRLNLERSLKTAIALGVKTIWVARDLGYRGGRRTGLALTDEVHLEAYSALYQGMPIERATKGPPVGERTAGTIWRMLGRIGEPVFLWNVFPLHPHHPNDPMSNRNHTARERNVGSRFLNEILELIKPDKVIAIGGDAHRAIEAMGIASERVRHPSYGGQNAFIKQIEAAYDLSDEKAIDLFTLPSARKEVYRSR